MNLGIIIYSETGHTLEVAKRLKTTLEQNGNKVNLEQIMITRHNNRQEFTFTNVPSIDQYDLVIVGSFVEAFSLNPVMSEYLKQLDNLNQIKVVCFLTQYFPFPWMGGNRSIKQMQTICEEKKAIVQGTRIINWSSKHREQQINDFNI